MAHRQQRAEEEEKLLSSQKYHMSSTFCSYSDVSSTSNPNTQTHLQSFDPNPVEIYSLTTGMEMIGFQPKTPTPPLPLINGIQNSDLNPNPNADPNPVLCKGFLGKSGSENPDQDQLMGAGAGGPWQDSNTRLLTVFPSERPSQGLSLSLSSSNPSSIRLQSFELRHTQNQNHHHQHAENQGSGFVFGKSSTICFNQQQQQGLMMQNSEFILRGSKYLGPAQELLNEFCSLGITKQSSNGMDPPRETSQKNKKCDFDDDHHQNINGDHNHNGVCSSSSGMIGQSLYGLDLLELQKRKSRLLAMLEELDRRYTHYCNQMKAVVSTFEAIAGGGAATAYSALARKAMSRHFRCLRDGIVGQIKATKEAMGEKETAGGAAGTTKGETPRLRMLDQALRRQRAVQQMGFMESHPWRPQRGLPERSVSVLRAWLFEHFLHPYPSDVDKHILARQTGLSRSQVSNWFINARVRLWKPMVEEMYLEETKEEQSNLASTSNSGATLGARSIDNNMCDGVHPIQSLQSSQEQKPTLDQLIRVDSECLSSIISKTVTSATTDKNDQNKIYGRNGSTSALLLNQHQEQQIQFGRVEPFGSMGLDHFHTYHENGDHHGHQNFVGGAGSGGVSLTLGLQQHGPRHGPVSLAFSPTAVQSSLFYGRSDDQMEDCQPVEYSLLDGDQSQNLPYRNLMGAQLLHDFT